MKLQNPPTENQWVGEVNAYIETTCNIERTKCYKHEKFFGGSLET